MKDSKPILLLLLAIALVGTWVYHLYDKSQYAVVGADAISSKEDRLRDSLKAVYGDSINRLTRQLSDATSNADTLRVRLDRKLGEIDQLKAEILAILNKPGVSKKDLLLARDKVTELQARIGDLNNANMLIGAEKDELNSRVGLLNQNADSLLLQIRQLNRENEVLVKKVDEASVLFATDVKLAAVELKASKEQVTAKANKADKFVVSFMVQNNVNSFDNAEVVLVIVQPDKSVLQNAKWDSGIFSTRNEGRMSYTRLVKFDYAVTDRRVLIFSLESPEFQKGAYSLQLWHKGVLIGQAVARLS